MALTGKMRVFADAILAGKSKKDAAIAAKYSAKTASAAGTRLAKDPRVVAYLAERQKAAAPGEKPTPAAPPFDPSNPILYTDPMAFLTAAMNDGTIPEKQRIEAAKALMPFKHRRLGEGGKKQEKEDAAKNLAGRFAPQAPPKLKAVK